MNSQVDGIVRTGRHSGLCVQSLDSVCEPAIIDFDNDIDPKYTVLSLQVSRTQQHHHVLLPKVYISFTTSVTVNLSMVLPCGM